MALLVGSRAMKRLFSDARNPVGDWDFWLTANELTQWAKTAPIKQYSFKKNKVLVKLQIGCHLELTIAEPGTSSHDFLNYGSSNSSPVKIFGLVTYIATPEMLLAIKESHIHHPIHWEKNIEDYHFLKQRVLQGVGYSREIEEILQKRIEETNQRWESKVNLNMSNDDFFGKSEGSLQRIYEHDDLHKATCYYDRPLYEQCKTDLSKAILSQELFNQLSEEDKIRLVREECFAIALERVVIPAMEQMKLANADDAFAYALKRICTTLTKGWFRKFAIDNYPTIRQNDRNYVDLFLKAVNAGTIRRKSDEVSKTLQSQRPIGE